MSPHEVWPLGPDDVEWAAALAADRREALAGHAPRLWRPAADAAARHRAFLDTAVRREDVVALRVDTGYLLGLPTADGRRLVVDDWAVDTAASPAERVEGRRALLAGLLAHAAERGLGVRMVAPVAETERRAAVEEAGLRPVEAWWHRDLPPARVTGEGGSVQLSAPGVRGRLVPAPPVHDPGGSVLLLTTADDPTALAAVETDAARRGATVAVVTARPDDLARELLLVGAGYALTTLFCETGARERDVS